MSQIVETYESSSFFREDCLVSLRLRRPLLLKTQKGGEGEGGERQE